MWIPAALTCKVFPRHPRQAHVHGKAPQDDGLVCLCHREASVLKVPCYLFKGPVWRISEDLLAEMEYNIFTIMFSQVCNHLKLRIVVILLPLNEPFTSTEGAGPPCCGAIFLQ